MLCMVTSSYKHTTFDIDIDISSLQAEHDNTLFAVANKSMHVLWVGGAVVAGGPDSSDACGDW